MHSKPEKGTAELLATHENVILAEWVGQLTQLGQSGGGHISDVDLRKQCSAFLAAFVSAFGVADASGASGAAFLPARHALDDICEVRATQGFTPRDVAMFIFSLKQPLTTRIHQAFAAEPQQAMQQSSLVSYILDELGIYTVDVYQKLRDNIISRQQEEIAELSTPVVTLWDNILALPLIGTLDSARTQVVMEKLLQAIVDTQAEIAIIDITGVPTVDTLVAQHLIKTVSAARLMGADCIISGIRPQIAQTMVHLGVELNVTTKATLAGALAVAFQRTGQMVVKRSEQAAPRDPSRA